MYRVIAAVAMVAGAGFGLTSCSGTAQSPLGTAPTTAAQGTTTPASAPTSASAAGMQSACTDLDGTVEADQTCHVHSEASNYTLDFRFPLDYPDQRALTEFLSKQRDEFLDVAAEQPMQGWTRPYELGIVGDPYRSGTPASGTESVVFTVYYDTGNHPVTAYDAFNYDSSRRAPITLDTLFKPGTQPVEVLDPIAQREMDKRWAGNGGVAQTNNLGAKVYQNFAITDDAVIFFIGQGMWLPEVSGPVEVSVPRAEIGSLLA